jgi:hypothetical protein
VQTGHSAPATRQSSVVAQAGAQTGLRRSRHSSTSRDIGCCEFVNVTWTCPPQMGHTRKVTTKTYIHIIDDPKPRAWEAGLFEDCRGAAATAATLTGEPLAGNPPPRTTDG